MSAGLRDVLSEILRIREPLILIGEWIPIEINQFEDFIEAIEAYKRGAASFMVSAIDKEPEDPIFPSLERLAFVKVIDYQPLDYVEFILKVFYPEEGAYQREILTVKLDTNGNILYGAKIVSIRKEDKESNWVSLDFLSRILTDIWEDTTEAMNSLLTSYQRRIMDIIYPFSTAEGVERIKVHVIISSDVTIMNKSLDNYKLEELMNLIF